MMSENPQYPQENERLIASGLELIVQPGENTGALKWTLG